ncbi:class I SAM-dependent methyltransferase [Candidatus Omnitrophota bacterium]
MGRGREEILRKIEELSPWGQKMRLIDDIYTPGALDTEHRWDFIKNFYPREMEGLRVLDLGCNAGFFSFKAGELGSDYVLGVDFEHYVKQANFIKEIKKIRNVNFKVDSLYRLNYTHKFDLTLCLGVLYHLKYPFFALKKISDCTSTMLLIETEALVCEQDTGKMKFIEHTYKNDGTNWWLFGEECLRGMLRSVGFKFVKTYYYPDAHFIFNKDYHEGSTEEGIKKARRIVMVALKSLNMNEIGMLLSEIPEMENEIDPEDVASL